MLLNIIKNLEDTAEHIRQTEGDYMDYGVPPKYLTDAITALKVMYAQEIKSLEIGI